MYEKELMNWYINIKKRKTFDLENPITFSQKIQWLKLFEATPLKTLLSDKYKVREWIADKIGEKYLVKSFGAYNCFDDIPFQDLPNKFVMKWNHASGFNFIVKNKSKLNKSNARRKMNAWGKEDYSLKSFELHYANIDRKILIEEFIKPETSTHEIQVYAFNGEIKFYTVETNKDINDSQRAVFMLDGQEAPFQITPCHYKPLTDKYSNKAVDEALRLSKVLASINEPFVRIDFIEYKDTVKFREMTFTSGSGLSQIKPVEYQNVLGDMIVLPKEKYDLVLKNK